MFLTASVGFYNQSLDDQLRAFHQMCEHGERLKAGGEDYLKWAVDEKLEMWTRVAGGKPDVKVHYYFAGAARMTVALLEKTPRRDRTLSDGAFLCRTRGIAGDGWVAGRLPFVFDTPEYHRYDGLKLPRVAEVQLTAFAVDLTGYETAEEFDEAFPPDEHDYCWDYKHFAPLSLITERGEGGELQQPGGAAGGFVLETEIVTNPLTGLDYCWAKIETVGGEMDVVCSPDKLSGYLVPGGLAAGHFYLYGRPVEDASN